MKQTAQGSNGLLLCSSRPCDLAHYRLVAELVSDSRRVALTPVSRDQVQTDSKPAGVLLRNLELLRSCISKRGKVTYKM